MSTYSKLEERANRLVVAHAKSWVASVEQLLNVFTVPQNTITPRWSSVFRTEMHYQHSVQSMPHGTDQVNQ